jgi:hypothetical protein
MIFSFNLWIISGTIGFFEDVTSRGRSQSQNNRSDSHRPQRLQDQYDYTEIEPSRDEARLG